MNFIVPLYLFRIKLAVKLVLKTKFCQNVFIEWIIMICHLVIIVKVRYFSSFDKHNDFFLFKSVSTDEIFAQIFRKRCSLAKVFRWTERRYRAPSQRKSLFQLYGTVGFLRFFIKKERENEEGKSNREDCVQVVYKIEKEKPPTYGS